MSVLSWTVGAVCQTAVTLTFLSQLRQSLMNTTAICSTSTDLTKTCASVTALAIYLWAIGVYCFSNLGS